MLTFFCALKPHLTLIIGHCKVNELNRSFKALNGSLTMLVAPYVDTY